MIFRNICRMLNLHYLASLRGGVQAIKRQATINKLFGEVSNKQQFSGNTSKVVNGRPYKIELDFQIKVILIFEEKGKPEYPEKKDTKAKA